MTFPDTIISDGVVFTKTRQWVSPRGWEKAEYRNNAHWFTTITLTGDFVSLSI